MEFASAEAVRRALQISDRTAASMASANAGQSNANPASAARGGSASALRPPVQTVAARNRAAFREPITSPVALRDCPAKHVARDRPVSEGFVPTVPQSVPAAARERPACHRRSPPVASTARLASGAIRSKPITVPSEDADVETVAAVRQDCTAWQVETAAATPPPAPTAAVSPTAANWSARPLPQPALPPALPPLQTPP